MINPTRKRRNRTIFRIWTGLMIACRALAAINMEDIIMEAAGSEVVKIAAQVMLVMGEAQLVVMEVAGSGNIMQHAYVRTFDLFFFLNEIVPMKYSHDIIAPDICLTKFIDHF
jgi:hypothetical protein